MRETFSIILCGPIFIFCFEGGGASILVRRRPFYSYYTKTGRPSVRQNSRPDCLPARQSPPPPRSQNEMSKRNVTTKRYNRPLQNETSQLNGLTKHQNETAQRNGTTKHTKTKHQHKTPAGRQYYKYYYCCVRTVADSAGQRGRDVHKVVV